MDRDRDRDRYGRRYSEDDDLLERDYTGRSEYGQARSSREWRHGSEGQYGRRGEGTYGGGWGSTESSGYRRIRGGQRDYDDYQQNRGRYQSDYEREGYGSGGRWDLDRDDYNRDDYTGSRWDYGREGRHSEFDRESGYTGGRSGYGRGTFTGSGFESGRGEGQYRGRQRGYSSEQQSRYSRGYQGEEQEEDRGWLEKVADAVASLFGDEDAARRRRMDEIRSGEHRGRGPKGYRRSDERIREDINDRFTDNDFLDASDIEVIVSEGEATLTGIVKDRNSKRLAEDIAERVSGVRNVENRLRVQQTESINLSDTSTTRTGLTGMETSTTTPSTSAKSTTTGS
jgi:osmotically-inducible protein OsmY